MRPVKATTKSSHPVDRRRARKPTELGIVGEIARGPIVLEGRLLPLNRRPAPTRFPLCRTPPLLETHAPLPVVFGRGAIELPMLHDAASSGVPAAARCHSWFVTRRLFESAQACSAWNHEMQVLGSTPGTDAALDRRRPVAVHGEARGYGVWLPGIHPSSVAPPAIGKRRLPTCTSFTSEAFEGGIRQMSLVLVDAGGADLRRIGYLRVAACTGSAHKPSAATPIAKVIGRMRIPPVVKGDPFFVRDRRADRRPDDPAFIRGERCSFTALRREREGEGKSSATRLEGRDVQPRSSSPTRLSAAALRRRTLAYRARPRGTELQIEPDGRRRFDNPETISAPIIGSRPSPERQLGADDRADAPRTFPGSTVQARAAVLQVREGRRIQRHPDALRAPGLHDLAGSP